MSNPAKGLQHFLCSGLLQVMSNPAKGLQHFLCSGLLQVMSHPVQGVAAFPLLRSPAGHLSPRARGCGTSLAQVCLLEAVLTKGMKT
jgi:hypothetical protein